eukprot:g22956.t1
MGRKHWSTLSEDMLHRGFAALAFLRHYTAEGMGREGIPMSRGLLSKFAVELHVLKHIPSDYIGFCLGNACWACLMWPLQEFWDEDSDFTGYYLSPTGEAHWKFLVNPLDWLVVSFQAELFNDQIFMVPQGKETLLRFFFADVALHKNVTVADLMVLSRFLDLSEETKRLKRADLIHKLVDEIGGQDQDFISKIKADMAKPEKNEKLIGDELDEFVLAELPAEDQDEFRLVAKEVDSRKKAGWSLVECQWKKAMAKKKAKAKPKGKAKAKPKAKAKCGFARRRCSWTAAVAAARRRPAARHPLNSLASTTRSCESAVAGHNGDLTVLCSGGVLVADQSGCSPRGCSAITPAVQVVVGGSTREFSTSKAMAHGEQFTAESCSNIDSGYEGVLNVTCHLGSLVANSCTPKPCQDTMKYVTHAGLNLVARLNAASLGAACSGAWTALRGRHAGKLFRPAVAQIQLDEKHLEPRSNWQGEKLTIFDLSRIAAAPTETYGLDLGNCYLNSCELPSAAMVHLGTQQQVVSLQTKNPEGGQESFDCSTVSADYSGQGQLVCIGGRLYSSVAGCSASGGSSACSADARAATQKDGVWTVGHGRVSCALCFRCFGIFRVDVNNCQPQACGTDVAVRVQLGPNVYSIKPSSEASSGSSWTVLCSTLDTEYEGEITVSCLRGTMSATGFCKELSCGTEMRQLTYSGASIDIELSGATVTAADARTPSNFSNSSVACSALAAALNGLASVSCQKGVYTLDASGCSVGDCQPGNMKTPMGSRDRCLNCIDQSMPHASSSTRSCASVMFGWVGSFQTGQGGQVQQAVKVVESAVAFALPTIQGASQEDLQAAMDTPSTKLAYAATLAASLGLANQEDENATNTEVDELAQSDTMSLLMGVVGALAAVFLCAFIDARLTNFNIKALEVTNTE